VGKSTNFRWQFSIARKIFFHGSESTIVGDIFGFPKMGLPQNGWSIMENLIKVVMWGYLHVWKPASFLGNPIIDSLLGDGLCHP
jgi:hypothetical protein